MTTREAALALLEETRQYYYNEDWSMKGNHSYREGSSCDCAYSGDGGKHCAIGRLDPDYQWKEGYGVTCYIINTAHVVELLNARGIASDPYITEYAVYLQRLHDKSAYAKDTYAQTITFINNAWPE